MKQAVLGLMMVASIGCAGALQTATVGEHTVVQSVHIIVNSEKTAYESGAFDNVQHQKNVAILLKVVQSEKVLNDTLQVWNASQGQPTPLVVKQTVTGLNDILTDLTPLETPGSSVAIVLEQIRSVIAALGGN